ncbi:hypothetical protein [Actinomadura nitritigenes]|uniref:hypothetical protein n=1 Tax=Actinomadura nitritigenes TaxID=134602 RepID=UPI003D8DFB0B
MDGAGSGEREAAAAVLRSWRIGWWVLCGYAACALAVLCALGARDHRVPDFARSAAAVVACGCAGLGLVKYRNVRAGRALARWRPRLAGPAGVAETPRVGYGGVVFAFALLADAALGLLVEFAAMPGGRSPVFPVFCLAVTLLCLGGGGLRWLVLARRPYLAEVRKVLRADAPPAGPC